MDINVSKMMVTIMKCISPAQRFPKKPVAHWHLSTPGGWGIHIPPFWHAAGPVGVPGGCNMKQRNFNKVVMKNVYTHVYVIKPQNTFYYLLQHVLYNIMWYYVMIVIMITVIIFCCSIYILELCMHDYKLNSYWLL